MVLQNKCDVPSSQRWWELFGNWITGEFASEIFVPCTVRLRWCILYLYLQFRSICWMLWEVTHCVQESDENCVSDTELRFLNTLRVIFENICVDKRRNQKCNWDLEDIFCLKICKRSVVTNKTQFWNEILNNSTV